MSRLCKLHSNNLGQAHGVMTTGCTYRRLPKDIEDRCLWLTSKVV